MSDYNQQRFLFLISYSSTETFLFSKLSNSALDQIQFSSLFIVVFWYSLL